MKLQWKTLFAAGIAALLSVASLSSSFAGQWEERETEGEKQWLWQKDDGAYAAESWEQIDGKWYRFNPEGIMVKGWFFDNANQAWYWLEESGAMASDKSWKGGRLASSGAWISNRVPPANSFSTTEEEDAYWLEKWQEYGLPDFTSQNGNTQILTYTYDPGTTVLPDLYNAVYAKASYTFNGFEASWNMSSGGLLTFVVTDYGSY